MRVHDAGLRSGGLDLRTGRLLGTAFAIAGAGTVAFLRFLMPDAADLAAWLPGALKQVTRTLKHTGNLRYLFGLTPGMKRLVAESTSYPPQPYPRVQISAASPRP